MDTGEARNLLKDCLDRAEDLGYDALSKRIGETEAFEVPGASSRPYQIEFSILWDHNPKGAIRVPGSIDDDGLRAFMPLTDSRLVSAPSSRT